MLPTGGKERNGWLVCFFKTARFCPDLLSILPHLTFTEVQQSFFFFPSSKACQLLRESSTLMSFEKVFVTVIYGKAFCMFMQTYNNFLQLEIYLNLKTKFYAYNRQKKKALHLFSLSEPAKKVLHCSLPGETHVPDTYKIPSKVQKQSCPQPPLTPATWRLSDKIQLAIHTKNQKGLCYPHSLLYHKYRGKVLNT